MRSGAIPPALVYGNPAFLRPCTIAGSDPSPARYLHVYAADLMRGPDGIWRVVADRADQGRGLAYALENRRNLARIVPEIFQNQQIEPLRPFMESTGEALRTLAPGGGGGAGSSCCRAATPIQCGSNTCCWLASCRSGWLSPGILTIRWRLRLPKDPARPGADQRAVPPPGWRAHGSA